MQMVLNLFHLKLKGLPMKTLLTLLAIAYSLSAVTVHASDNATPRPANPCNVVYDKGPAGKADPAAAECMAARSAPVMACRKDAEAKHLAPKEHKAFVKACLSNIPR